VVASATGQGLVYFRNAGQEFSAPFFDSSGVLLSGTNYLVQMYAGMTPDALFGFGTQTPFLTGANAGYFAGPDVELPPSIVGGCGPAWVQFRAWRPTGGATFEQATLAGAWTGISSTVYLPYTGGFCSGGVPNVPPPLIGLAYPGTPLIVQQRPDQRVRPIEFGALWGLVASGGAQLSYQ
jgi:hypothetical protein